MNMIESVWAVEHPWLVLVAVLIAAAITAGALYVERKRAQR